ncbi:MAG: hypothetical protein ACKVU0_18175 [Saprospiraceae bacterium]
MKQLALFSFLFLAFVACKNDVSPKNEAVQTSPENQATEPQNLNRVNETVTNLSRTEAETPHEDSPKSIITGSNVTMRKEASVKSEKIGSFEQNEKVEILETKNVNNESEAILNKSITLKGSGAEVNLLKGKAVIIEEYKTEGNLYRVSYQDPQKGKLTAEIDASAVETITYSTWYKVKRMNGETGWVLGKFLKTN